MNQPNTAALLLEVDAKRICVIKPSALGDVVQALPVLPALRRRFPRARISWVISRSLAPLLEGHPDLDEVVPFERRGSLGDWRRLMTRLRRSRFDLVFDLQGLLRSGLMLWATKASLRVGLESAREGSMWGCHFLIPGTDLSVPAHLRTRRVVDALGLANFPAELRLGISRSERQWATRQLAPLGGSVLAIHPGASWKTKRWLPERFAAVASKALRHFGLSPVVLGAPDECGLSAQFVQTLHQLAPNARPVNLTGRTNLKQLAAVLEQSRVLLTNDSGPMQLAAGLGTPVVGIFTCTSPTISGPPGDQHELVATGVKCAASYRKRCPYRGKKHLACMEELDVERVWAGLCRLMQKNAGSAKAA
jgi:lipopolysaccharide heptosyltransferase II